MATTATNVIAIEFEQYDHRRVDVLGRIGQLARSETLEMRADFDAIALRSLLEALLPGTFAWEFATRPSGHRVVRITRL
jgi:uncharacterized protein (DUF2249 family)